MATSGSVDFSVTGTQILTMAYQEIGVLREGGTLTSTQESEGLLRLNMIVKQWQGKADFAPGLKVWTRKRGTIFLEYGKASYVLGPSGDHATTDTYIETTLTADAATSATTLTVADITGINASDEIGIILDDGTVHWTTVNGAPSGSTVTITTGLASAAATGKTVWTFTNKIAKPLQILYVNRRNSNGDDSPLYSMDLEEYESINDKDQIGTPTRHYYEKGRLTGELFLDYAISDVTDLLKVTFLRPIEDMDAVANDLDYPQNWFRPLAYELAMALSLKHGIPITVDLKLLRDDALAIATNSDPETSEDQFIFDGH